MARVIRPEDGVVVGLRDHLAARCRATITTLSTECELYDFSGERDRQRDRLMDIQTGRDVLVYRHEIPHDLLPPRTDEIVYTLRGDRLVPAEYERAAPLW